MKSAINRYTIIKNSNPDNKKALNQNLTQFNSSLNAELV